MPRKPKLPDPLPEHIEEYLAGLEAQILAGEMPNRDKALQPVEQKLGRIINIDAELQEHPAALERFALIRSRTMMRLEDGAIERAGAGRASATTLLRGMGAITPSGGGSGRSGRLQLEREHRPRVAAHRKGW